jgi:O-antigen ligase
VSFYYLLPGAAKPPTGMNVLYASYGHSHLADVLLLSLPLALAFFLKAKNRRHEILLSLLILLYIVALVLTFSRGAFLVLPFVVLFLLFLAKPRLPSQKFLSWLAILLPIGLIGLIGIFSKSDRLEAKLNQPQNWLVKQLVKPNFRPKDWNIGNKC